jgi:hypothetical protein
MLAKAVVRRACIHLGRTYRGSRHHTLGHGVVARAALARLPRRFSGRC